MSGKSFHLQGFITEVYVYQCIHIKLSCSVQDQVSQFWQCIHIIDMLKTILSQYIATSQYADCLICS